MIRVLAVAVLLLGSLTGCSSPTEDYCSSLKDEQATLEELSAAASTPTSLDQTIEVFEKLRSEAPEDIGDEWDTFAFAWHGLDDALDAAGVDIADFDPEKRPVDVTQAQFDAVTGAAEKLRSAPVVDAAAGIEQHGQDICKVSLGL